MNEGIYPKTLLSRSAGRPTERCALVEITEDNEEKVRKVKIPRTVLNPARKKSFCRPLEGSKKQPFIVPQGRRRRGTPSRGEGGKTRIEESDNVVKPGKKKDSQVWGGKLHWGEDTSRIT